MKKEFLIFLMSLLFLPIVWGAPATSTSCGDVSGDLTLTADVNSTGTCFNILAADITLNCAGHKINYSTAGITNRYGIDNTGGYDNVTVKNCNIYEGNVSGSSKYGIYLTNAANNSFDKVNITTSGSYARPIYIKTSSDNYFENSVIETSGIEGVLIESGDRNTFKKVNISSASSGVAVQLSSASNNNFSDCRMVSYWKGMDIGSQCDNNIVEHCYIESTGTYPAVSIYYGDNNQFLYNTINQSHHGYNGGNGFSLSTANNNKIIGNNISNAKTTFDEGAGAVLYISNSQGTNVTGNRFDNPDQESFYVSGTSAAQYNHIFSNNLGDGVAVEYIRSSDTRNSLSNANLRELWVAKDNFVVDNVTMDNSEGFVIAYADNVTVNKSSFNSSWGKQLNNAAEGAYLTYSANASFYNVNITTSGSGACGVYLNYANNNSFDNMNITTSGSSGQGIYLSNSVNNYFYNINSSVSNAYGVYISDDGSDGNWFEDSTVSSVNGGVYIGSGDENTFKGVNVSTGGSGFSLSSATLNNLSNVHIVAQSHGVYLYFANNNIVENSYVESSGGANIWGIYSNHGNNNQFLYNVINQSNNGGSNAVHLNTANNNIFIGNNISNAETSFSESGGAVLYIYNSAGTNITDNRFVNPNQNKLYMDNLAGTATFADNYFSVSNGNVQANSLRMAAGTALLNFSNNIFVGPKFDLDGFQFNMSNSTFRSADGTADIVYPSLVFNGSANFRLNASNVYVLDNISAVDPASVNLNESFNTTANVTFYGVSCSGYGIYYDSGFETNYTTLTSGTKVASTGDTICSNNVCTNIACSGGTLTMTVPEWSSFGVKEEAAPAVPEFSDYAVLLILVVVGGGFLFMQRRNKK